MHCIGQVEISGVVVDETGERLIGANILAKGTDVGTVTDIDGSFRLTIDNNVSHLVVSFTGLETKEVLIDPEELMQISLSIELIVTACYLGPGRNIRIGGSFDFTNSLGGLSLTNTLPRFINNAPLTTFINYKMGNNSRLTFETRNEINLQGYYSDTPINLALEIDYLKNAWFDYDIVKGIDYRRFAIIPNLSKGRYTFEIGYINQKELNFFSKSLHGIVTGVNIQTPFGLIIHGRTELLLNEVQHKFKLEKHIPALRTSISVDYKHLQNFKALSLSAQYKFWY